MQRHRLIKYLAGIAFGLIVFMSGSHQALAATPWGTANYGLANFGGYLHYLACYVGGINGAPYRSADSNGIDCIGNADASWWEHLPFPVAEFSIRQTGTSPGTTVVMSYQTKTDICGPGGVDFNTGLCNDGAAADCVARYGSGTATIKGECYPPSTQSYGTTPSFAQGSSVTLEWSCQPYVTRYDTHCGGVTCSNTSQGVSTVNFFQNVPLHGFIVLYFGNTLTLIPDAT